MSSDPIERIEVGRIRKSGSEDLVIHLVKFQDGNWRLSTRVFFTSVGGDKLPDRHGWTIPISALPELAGAIACAVQGALDRALIE